MTVTNIIDDICAEINNYFVQMNDIAVGTFSIVEGKLVPDMEVLDGQYYRIVGSVFNDGVHYSDDVLKDEPDFRGGMWLMRVPQDVIECAERVITWMDSHAGDIASPYTSESFGGYSYTKGANANGTVGTDWKNQAEFAGILKKYRKARVL